MIMKYMSFNTFSPFQEFLTYAKTYKQALTESREQEKLLLKGAGGQLYSSKAYFER